MRANSKHLILFLSLAFLTGFQRLLPQTNDFIEGKVINSATSEPVAFATIKLKKNMLGVYANSNGDFRISRNAEFFSDSLIITSIGYKQSSIAYKDLKEKSVNRIMLYPVVYGLAEVKVTASKKKLNSYIIIRRAIRNIRYNYPDKPFNYIAYYRDYQKREDKYLNLNEAIVQALDNGFNTWSRSNKYRLLDFRKNADFPKMNISPYYDVFESSDYNNPNKIIPNAILGDQYGNELFILMVHDAIRNFRTRSFSFVETFSDEFIFNHIFSEPVAVLNNNLLLYKIRFKGRAALTGSDLFASGAIYIQPKDYSIHKLEYACYYKPKNEEMKKMFNIDVEYGYENASDSRLYLKYISFNNFFRVLDPTDESYFRLVNSSWDTFHNIKPCVTLTFNNKIDPVSAARKENYLVRLGKKEAKIAGIQVIGKTLYIRLKDDLSGKKDSCLVTIRNINDINGNKLDRRKTIDLYQYRELFVQEYDKSPQLTDSCFMQYLPLDQNCIARFHGSGIYWMNTPENLQDNFVSKWDFRSFSKPAENPVLKADSTFTFTDPVRHEQVMWQRADVFNPAAIVKDNKVFLLYRSEDNPAAILGGRTSRIGLASSDDGIHFTKYPSPVLYPDSSEYMVYDYPGGCEDPRIVQTEDSLYVLLYTSWNYKVARLSVAFSKDLIHWEKKGPAFAKAYNGKYLDNWSKSGSVITRMVGDRIVAAKINGRYGMYWGENFVNLAWSDNLIDWYPTLNENGDLKPLISPRKNKFDSNLTECGPPAITNSEGIVLYYNGKNSENDDSDPVLPKGTYSVGRVVFDTANPETVLSRSDTCLLKPTLPHEISGQYKSGTTFSEGLVYFHQKWFLYYGTADSFVGVAVSE